MKLIRHAEYRVWFLEIRQDASWQDGDDNFAKQGKPVKLLGHFVKEMKDVYFFSSGIDEENDKPFDKIEIPKGCVVKIEKI